MRTVLIAAGLFVAGVLFLGAPFGQKTDIAPRYGSEEPILPMTFAHQDHTHAPCMDCHHNYVDDTGTQPCLHCHVTNEDVWPLFETQFHDLCRGCHEEKNLAGDESGPVRQCIACHVEELDP